MAEPLILGGAVRPFGRTQDGSTPRDWTREVVACALADAGIGRDEIDSVIVAVESDHLMLQLSPGALLADEAGFEGVSIQRIEAGGASGAAGIAAAVTQIRAGIARSVLVLGVEHAASHMQGRDVAGLYGLSFDADLEGFAGFLPIHHYALSIQLFMAEFGVIEADLDEVAACNHRNAMANPWAHRPMQVTPQDIANTDMLSTPYRKGHCSPLSDGAAAVIVAAEHWAPDKGQRRVRIVGSASANDRVRLGDRTAPGRFVAKRRAFNKACDMAGIPALASCFQVAEVYDAFAGAQLQALEALGLHGDKSFRWALDDGQFSGNGPLVINPSGGLIGQGAAPGATGIAQILFLACLINGKQQSTDRLATPPDRALADAHGGIGTVCFMHILEGD
uniref:Acetyl-CoA acetyltransferase n=1 Tax=Marinobacter nauticus TaxID=2743 RepID=A0A455W4J8_MARNT|nr:acetyl-CoA acetyltransferase [Marinobacter nauticus]